MSIKQHHSCRKCLYDTYRTYYRTKPHKTRYSWENKTKRKFIAIGWFCNYCKLFETDKTIEQREYKEEIKRKHNLKTDKEYNQFIKKQQAEDDKWRKENIRL